MAAASLDEINFMGPKAGWSTFKETADSLGASTGTSTRLLAKMPRRLQARPLLLLDTRLCMPPRHRPLTGTGSRWSASLASTARGK